MHRSTKIALAVAAVLVIVVLGTLVSIEASAGFAKTNTGTSSCISTGKGWSSDARRTFKKIGVISLTPKRSDRQFQEALVEELIDQLPAEVFFCEFTGEANSLSKAKTGVEVKQYPNREAALNDGADFVLNVKTDDWSASILPVRKKFSAKVAIKGSSVDWVVDGLQYSIDADIHPSGHITGLFNSRYLRSEVAEDIAEAVVEHMADDISEMAAKIEKEAAGKREPI